LLKSTRQRYHQQIAKLLETRWQETVERQPELVAHHYTEAGLVIPAMPYWRRAGVQALERSACLEAIGHLNRGLEVLQAMPETPERKRCEIDLQIPLGLALVATKGYAAPEVEGVYVRARALCEQVGQPAELLVVLRGLGQFYMNRAQLETARDLAEQRCQLADQLGDPVSLTMSHTSLVSVLYHMGEFEPALAQFERVLALPDVEAPPHSRRTRLLMVSCLSHAAWALWLLGAVDQSLARSRAALALARDLGDPFYVANGCYWAAQLHQYRRDPGRTQELGEAVRTLSAEESFPQQAAQGSFLRGWAMAHQGQEAAGWAEMREAFAAWEATGAGVLRPYYLALLAAVAARAGEVREALRLTDVAMVAVDKSGERSWLAEVHRLHGELLLQAGGGERDGSVAATEAAEACFQRALAVARHQRARSLELRAAMSLSRLWQRLGRRTAASELLTPVYTRFTEGLDTADLQEAKALVEALR
jgi:predicted ATPase